MFHLGGRKKPAFGSLEVRRVSGYRKHAQSKRNLRKSMKLILNIYIYISKFLLWENTSKMVPAAIQSFLFKELCFQSLRRSVPGRLIFKVPGQTFAGVFLNLFHHWDAGPGGREVDWDLTSSMACFGLPTCYQWAHVCFTECLTSKTPARCYVTCP